MNISKDADESVVVPFSRFGFAVMVETTFALSPASFELTNILYSSLITQSSEPMEISVVELTLIELEISLFVPHRCLLTTKLNSSAAMRLVKLIYTTLVVLVPIGAL